MPLAMSALPVYVQIPAYYATQLGVALAATGWILFLARFVDALQDPLLGSLIDRSRSKMVGWFCAGGTMLSIAFCGLWLPPVSGQNLLWWLALMLILAYLAHSMINIAYLAWGARLDRGASLLGASAWREGAGLVGVIVASVIPSLIFASSDVTKDLAWYSVAFAALLMLSIVALFAAAPAWQKVRPLVNMGLRQQWREVGANRAFVALLLPYFINAIAVAVPATLVVFFINDRLQAPQYIAAFLSTYFVAAAIGLPCWVRAANKWGVAFSWRTGMLLAMLAFISASLLGAGQVIPFFVICAASGFALGADLALPPVLLAQVIDAEAPPAAYYGIWTLLGKFALAISGLALPMLASLDYHPGQPAGAPLAWIYAGLPCVLKCIAFILLMRKPQFSQVRAV